MNITLILVPYDLGRERVEMGNGPVRYFEAGLAQNLEKHGHGVTVKEIKTNKPFVDELTSIVQINKLIAKEVAFALENNRFPLIVSGDCNVSMGALAGINDSQIGIIWLDAHGDYNTPQITGTGYFNGMPLAILNGHCYQDLFKEIGNKHVILDSQTMLIGANDLDPKEKKLLDGTMVEVIPANDIKINGPNSIIPKLEDFKLRAKEIYLHIDLDVIDPKEAPGITFKAQGGLSSKELEDVMGIIGERFNINAGAFTAYNPSFDQEDRTLKLGLKLIDSFVIASQP